MNHIMRIEDIHEIPGKGVVIAGVHERFDDTSQAEIVAYIGERVRVECGERSAEIPVLGISTTSSIVG